MRVYTILVAALLTLALTGVTAGSAHPARAEGSEQDLAVTATLSADACTTEDITFTGSVHITSNLGDNGHMVYHTNSHLQGVGVTTGDMYLENDVYTFVVNNQGAQTYTVSSTSSINSPGSGRLWEQSALVHITVNDLGETTAYVMDFVEGCQ